ncbi:hypothetical protein BDQ17DRAFT_873716 [Cyathus striatus]|nr:hypothetical protein BDQ17DRAFT_873716 [Cyathus striatus]
MAFVVYPHVCEDCGDYTSFPTQRGLQQHWMFSNRHACQDCSKYFKTSSALCYHYGEVHRCCNRCLVDFEADWELDEHRRTSPIHHVCHPCRRDFPTSIGLREHLVQSPGHHYCQYCDAHFSKDKDLEDHYKTFHYYCDQCKKVFHSEKGLKEHYRQSPAHIQCELCDEGFLDKNELDNHYKQSLRHFYCPDCKTHYRSKQNLDAHLKSSIHQPKTVVCPLKNCQRAFTTKAALVLHFESGKCGSGIDRPMIDKMVRQFDRNHIITDPSHMLTNGDSGHNPACYATDRSWNGHAFECYLCHDTFRSLRGLNAHLASPRHQTKMYICPSSTCPIRFSTLSGLIQHIESERCGILKFKPVQDALEMMLNRISI